MNFIFEPKLNGNDGAKESKRRTEQDIGAAEVEKYLSCIYVVPLSHLCTHSPSLTGEFSSSGELSGKGGLRILIKVSKTLVCQQKGDKESLESSEDLLFPT
jgi:hypothetical protein